MFLASGEFERIHCALYCSSTKQIPGSGYKWVTCLLSVHVILAPVTLVDIVFK